MKKSTLLNSELSYLVATLGHTDEITICDAGLPIPDEVTRIDLALTHGVPSFLETVRVILSESQIESVIVAQEFAQVSPVLHEALCRELKAENSCAVSQLPSNTSAMKRLNNARCKAAR